MNVPKLRFKEFNDEWIEYNLENISKIYDGTHQTPDYKNHGVKFVSVENINNINETDKFISKEAFEKEFKIKPKIDDILMTRITAGIIGATAIVTNNEPLGYYVSLALIRKNDSVDVNFLNQYIKSYLFKKELNKRIIHVAFPKKINLGDIGKCRVSITNKNEQEMIGKFLSLLDKKIELQTKKIEDLKLFKLCTAKIIFKDDSLLCKKQIKELCHIAKGKQINSEYLSETGKYYMLNGGINPSGFINEYNTNENTISISEGGNSCGYVNFNKSKFWAGGHCYTVTPIDINNIYLYQILKFNENKIMDLRVGSGLPNIQKKDLENFSVYVHHSNVQNKIATILSSIDKLIDLEEKKISNIEKLKKGLMQNMFV